MLKGAATGESGFAAEAERAPAPLVVSVVGTRPEAIKMRPVVEALATGHGVSQSVLLTGQHGGLDGFFPTGLIRHLDLPGLGDLPYENQRDLLQAAIARALGDVRPSLVLVHGDTTSAYAGALAASDLGLPIGHVEAGLRSGRLTEPWPEEGHRIAIDERAQLLFAPTHTAAANLAGEERATGAIHVTGNTGIDALHRVCQSLPPVPPATGRKPILVTSHRRENRDEAYASLCEGLRRAVAELPVEITYLLHTNPHLQAAARAALYGVDHISLSQPASHPDTVALLRGSWAVVTDSGGMQEEGAALGVPVLVLRKVTERVEAPENIRLCGTEPDMLVDAIHDLLMNDTRYAAMSVPSLAFGDGHAGSRIAAIIEAWLASGGMQPRHGQAVGGVNKDWTP